MRFCETNRICRGAIFDVTPYAEGSCGRAAQKVNPVRLERNGAKGGVAMAVFLPHSSGPLVAGTVTGKPLPREWRDIARWGFYPMALVLESSVREWYTTEFEVDLNQGVAR